jgi:hypothetical protein
MKRVLLALGLLGCSGGAPPPTPVPPQPAASAPIAKVVPDAGASEQDPELSSKESKAVARTLTRVSEIRGIKATKPVPGVKLEREKLVARIKEKALREYPPEALRREGQLLQLFGFAPPTFDYLEETLKLLEAQLEGFYEPKNGTMYLAADLKGKEAQATLAHELVHALQDQSWDLKSRSDYKPGRGDETLALACLAEGDATSVMMDYVFREQEKTALDIPEDMLRSMLASGMNITSIQSVPHILRSTLIAPYIDGLLFVHALRKKGGFPMVDKGWNQLPTTTEQVLHFDKWEAHEAPLQVKAPTAEALGSGWKLDDEDTFGELGFALTFEEWVDAPDARRAAAGWGGDRSAVYTKGDEIAFAVRLKYDAASFAERAMSKVPAGIQKKLGKGAIASPNAVCVERKELGPLLMMRKGADVILTAGPARSTKGTWSSTSTCADAKKWADEIVR